MVERITAWRCIGCGKIDAPQPCIGVCQDRSVELVSGSDYDAALAELEAARRRTSELMAIVQQIARVTPREGQWERTYRALQARAREVVDATAKKRVTGKNTAG